MKTENIVISVESYESPILSDIIESNALYIDRLFKQQIKDTEIFEDALFSYHVNFYLAHMKHGGFLEFMHSYYKEEKVINSIRKGLIALKAYKNLHLLNKILYIYDTLGINNINKMLEIKCTDNFSGEHILNFFDKSFIELQKEESLIQHNYDFLINHPKLLILTKDAIYDHIITTIISIISNYKITNNTHTEADHIKLIKKLCKNAQLTFRYMTAKDPNNIFSNTWYFMTNKGHFYIIERDNEVKLFNNINKKFISSITLKTTVSDSDSLKGYLSA